MQQNIAGKTEYDIIKGVKKGMSQLFDAEAKLIPYTSILVLDAEDLQKFKNVEQNQRIRVSGKTKGRGFAGTVKRWGFHMGPKTHGWERSRSPGSIGTQGQGRVIPGKKMPGRMGDEKKTVELRFLGVDESTKTVKLRGSIPGSRNSEVLVYIERFINAG